MDTVMSTVLWVKLGSKGSSRVPCEKEKGYGLVLRLPGRVNRRGSNMGLRLGLGTYMTFNTVATRLGGVYRAHQARFCQTAI